ncbi:glycosyltransferase [Peribacillus frigoritolerans]|uniref:glycosyltransferase n=1 Tax=Peribacillus frigoritolerans TaxID=450367 RepID=UPI00227E1C3C|nr:glycosyltransferase [Peribacillus frigoritolerans]MCY9006776.1 glycosyltransferase [Peribacillus frigoritolerans]
MRILFVISSTGIGGEQRVASILTNQFIEKKNSVDILTFEKSDKAFKFNSDINFISIKNSKGVFKNINRIRQIRKLIKKGDYDVIIGFAVIPSILCSLANIGLNFPVVVCERNDPDVYSKKWKFIRSIAYKFAKGAVFQTTEAMDYFSGKYFKKRIVIHNPINIAELPTIEGESKRNVIVNTARLTSAKNHKLLIKAFSRIAKDFEDYKLEIYGDGPLRESLLDLINELGLNKRIVLYEATPNVLEKIKYSQIFVLTSNNEGFPNSLAEAMAMGIPSISTNCRIGGPKEMIVNDKNGLLININDLEGLENAFRKVIVNKELRDTFSKESFKIRNKLDSKVIGSRWIEFLNTLVKN